MFFRERLMANLRVMLEEYVTREVILKDSYLVGSNPVTNEVCINYVLNNYDDLKDKMTQTKYDSYREKLQHYCIRTAEMLTATGEVNWVVYDERMMRSDYEEPELKKHMEIY